MAMRGNFLQIALRMSQKGYFTQHTFHRVLRETWALHYHILHSPCRPLPEGTFSAPELEVSPTETRGERQVLGKSSSEEPSTIFPVGTSDALVGMSVSDTPTEQMSVHKSPQTLNLSVRAQSDSPTELASETP